MEGGEWLIGSSLEFGIFTKVEEGWVQTQVTKAHPLRIMSPARAGSLSAVGNISLKNVCDIVDDKARAGQ
jgi:hypothetical protein